MLKHYLEKLKMQFFCRYLAIIPDMEENANKLHFNCTDFNSSARVTVYDVCIYVFYRNLVLVAEYHVDHWHTLQWRLLWWISISTNWSQQWHGKFYLQSVRGKLTILNTENIKICGSVTKLEATKVQLVCIFFHICWISVENLNF